jgi:hypothetical protein
MPFFLCSSYPFSCTCVRAQIPEKRPENVEDNQIYWFFVKNESYRPPKQVKNVFYGFKQF